MRVIGIVTVLFGMLVACGGESAQSTTPQTPAGSTAGAGPSAGEPQTFGEQATVGQKLYADNCASCHGESGEGSGKSPRVVGLAQGALPLAPPPASKMRKTEFKTAKDLGEWTAKNMPPGQGGSLKDWEYWAIVAFDLKANGLSSDKKLDASTANDVALHK